MAEVQKLRWWQEPEEQSQKSQEASERLSAAASPLLSAVAPSPVAEEVMLAEEQHDTWAELEAEAVRRAEQAKKEETESVSFHLNRTAVLADHRRQARLLWVFGSLLLAIFVFLPLGILLFSPHHHHHFPSFGAMGGLFAIFSTYARRREWLKNNDKPALRLAPEGIYLASFQYPNAFMPWNDITSITPKRSFKQRYLEFRVGKRFRYNLEERYLPLSVDALAARIAAYETGQQKA